MKIIYAAITVAIVLGPLALTGCEMVRAETAMACDGTHDAAALDALFLAGGVLSLTRTRH